MKNGFTLSELLIALAILGVIATFTIPKVLQSQQDGKYKAMAKEAVATVSQAYEAYRLKNTVYGSLKPVDLLPYFNYVQYDTASSIDLNYNNASSQPCTLPASGGCLRMHNGGVILLSACGLGGTATTNAMQFYFDPDGKHDASATGPAKALEFHLYSNGKIRNVGDLEPNTYSSCGGPDGPDASKQPPWFSWN